jgi:ABC-type transport system substrate-binding protein
VSSVDYDSAAFSISNLPTDPAIYLFQYYNSAAGLRQSTDDHLDDLTTRTIAESDDEKRKALVHEIQVYEAGANWFPRMGAALSLSLNWPALRNYGVYQGGSGLGSYNNHARLFIDPTKASS